MRERLILAHIACAGADHDRELDLPVRLHRAFRDHDVVVRSDDAVGRLGEQHRLLGNRHAQFGGVVGIIEPDGDEIANPPQARPDSGRAPHRRQGFRLELGQTRERARSERVGVDVLDDLAEVPELTGLVDERRLLLARPAISREFHHPSPIEAARSRAGTSRAAPFGRDQVVTNARGAASSILAARFATNC